MIRVFGEPGAEPADGAKEAGGEAIEVVRLKAENAGLRAVIEAKDETIRTQADALLRLTGPKADPAPQASADPMARRVLIALAVFTALVIAAVAFDLPSRIL